MMVAEKYERTEIVRFLRGFVVASGGRGAVAKKAVGGVAKKK